MLKTVLIAGLSAMAATAAHADGIDIDIQNFTAHRGIAKIVMKVTNGTDADISSVFIDCAFLDGNKRAIDIGKAMIPSLPSGQYAYEEASIPRSDGVEFAECRVTKFR